MCLVCRRRELSLCGSLCISHYIQKCEGFRLSISCIVQWQNVCLALLLLPSANAHSLKEKTNGFKPNGPSEVTSTSFKGSSFTPPRPPHPSAQERLQIHHQNSFCCHFQADCFGFAVLSQTFSMLSRRTHLPR